MKNPDQIKAYVLNAYLLTGKHVFIADQIFAHGNSMKNTILDVIAAVAVGLVLCIGALHYFDVLVK